ncbi:hypothetical protein ACX0MV_04690 [Pseudomonas borbori]
MLGFLSLAAFAGLAFWRGHQPLSPEQIEIQDRVVISAPILIVLYGGDRFLAANLEAIRLAATGMHEGEVDTNYLIRAQQVVAQLNACHEDNYYLANGLLTWGGAVSEGNQVLRAAVDCRTWDYVPAFFYGINLAFFQRDIAEARRMLEVGAQRSPENAASLRKLAIMLQAETFSDEKLALNYLTQQRDSVGDPALREMLDKRVGRLRGLVTLREAKRRFELTNEALMSLNQLIDHGLLPVLPEDPVKLGYELRNGQIVLRKMNIAGMEDQP